MTEHHEDRSATRTSWPILLFSGVAALLVAAGPLAAAVGRWTPVGPEGGGPRLIAASPQSAARLYAAFPSGPYGSLETAVMRTEDGGATWQESNSGLEGERIVALAVDPEDSDRVFAVAAVQGCFSDDPGGVYRTEDAGAHWQRIATSQDVGFLACGAGLVVIPDAVLIGIRGGVARSTDDGATWQPIRLEPNPDEVHTLVVDPFDQRVLYAAGWLARYKSVDGGLTWTLLADPASQDRPWVTAFAISASDPGTLYEYGFDYPESALWRSRDGGTSWEEALPAPAAGGLDSVKLLVDPENPETLFLGTEDGLWASRDGGAHFHLLRRDLPALTPDRTSFSGVTALALDAGNRILLGARTGIWSSMDAGFHWTAAPMHGVHLNTIRFLLFDPFDRRRILFTSFDTLFESRDGGDTFAPLFLPGLGVLKDIDFDPFERGRLVALTVETRDDRPAVIRIFESRDGGHVWRSLALAPANAVDLSVPAPHDLLVAAENHIYLKQGVGGGWRQELEVVPADERGGFFFTGIVADPYLQGALFAVGFDRYLHAGEVPVLFRSLDAGRTWRRWRDGVQAFAFDPAQADTVYTVEPYFDVYRRRASSAGGRRLGTISPRDVPSALLVDRRDPQTLLVATAGHGVLVSHDSARHWSSFAPGLPLAGKDPLTALEQDRTNPRRFFAAPTTGGLWRLDL